MTKDEKELLIKEQSKIFSYRLSLLRDEKNWTQAQLAQKVGLATSSIQKFELRQRYPSGIDLVLLAENLDVSIDYLIGKTENRKVEYASLDELGLNTTAIDTLKALNNLVYKKKRLDEKALLVLDTLNILLTKKNCSILYSMGYLLLIKKIFDNYYADSLKKLNNFTKYPAYDLYSFKLSKKIDNFCKENASKCLSQAVIKNIDNEDDLQKLIAQIDGLQQSIVNNPKDYFYTPTEQKVLFAKEEEE
ncbi:MAG: helix-turn-helix domain-containing protein [Ignavibacteriales bacterium]